MKNKKLRTIEKKKVSKECWNLDYSFYKWLNEHLKVFKKEASKIVDLEYRQFEYGGRKWTQMEIIDRLIFLSGQLILDYFDWGDFSYEYDDQLHDLWKLVCRYMWW